jgi:hypothetical protein
MFLRAWAALIKRHGTLFFALAAVVFLGLFAIPQIHGSNSSQEAVAETAVPIQFHYFEFLKSSKYSGTERGALFVALGIALAGL